MSKATETSYDDVLDEGTLQLLGDAPAVLDIPPEQMQRLRDRVMQRVADEGANASQSFITVRADAGPWIQLAPGIVKKVLFSDPETGTESYLLKAEPGTQAPPHDHTQDEHCLVLEGEVTYGDRIHLRAGDYHFAPGGSKHSTARTETGVLVYIQTVRRSVPAVL